MLERVSLSFFKDMMLTYRIFKEGEILSAEHASVSL